MRTPTPSLRRRVTATVLQLFALLLVLVVVVVLVDIALGARLTRDLDLRLSDRVLRAQQLTDAGVAPPQLVSLLLIVAAFVLVLGVGTALRPLDRMTALARRITAGDRGTRLDPDRPGSELGRAAAAFDGMLDALEDAETRGFLSDAAHSTGGHPGARGVDRTRAGNRRAPATARAAAGVGDRAGGATGGRHARPRPHRGGRGAAGRPDPHQPAGQRAAPHPARRAHHRHDHGLRRAGQRRGGHRQHRPHHRRRGPRTDLRAAGAAAGVPRPRHDNIDAGAGADTLFGDDGDDFLVGGLGVDQIFGGAGNDKDSTGSRFSFSDPTDIVDLGPGQQDGLVFFGTDGNDKILIDVRAVRLPTDPHRELNDAQFADAAARGVVPALRYAVFILNGQRSETLYKNGETIMIHAAAGDDVVTCTLNAGRRWQMAFLGEDGNDVLIGGVRKDHLLGGNGNDTLIGNDGDDRLDGGFGSDRMSGGLGNDTVYYTDRNENLSLSLDNVANDGAAGEKDSIESDVENLEGSFGNDTLRGNAGVNILKGFAGNDKLYSRDSVADILDGGTGFDSAQKDAKDKLTGIEAVLP